MTKNEDTELRELLDGLLLGDGSLYVNKKHKKPTPCYQHSDNNKEYLLYIKSRFEKYNLLLSGKSEDQIYTRYRWNKYSYSFKTRNNIILKPYRDRWYPEGKKIVPLDLVFSPITVLHWFIGDGTVQKTAYSTRIQIATHSFSSEENELLSLKLNDIGIKSIVKTHIRAGNYLAIRQRSCLDFLDYMDECPVNCYRYKWDKVTSSLIRSQAC